MSNLYANYKKKRIMDAGGALLNSGLLDSVTTGTGADAYNTGYAAKNVPMGTYSAKSVGTGNGGSGIGAGIAGNATGIGSFVNEGIDTFSKGDPLTGRKSIGSSVGKSAVSGAALGTTIMPGWGTLIGGVIGAGIGFFSGKKQKKNAMNALSERQNNNAAFANNMSAARVQSDPSLINGYRGAGYFALGGSMLGLGEDPETKKKGAGPTVIQSIGTKTVKPGTSANSTYTSYDQIEKDNKFARDFAERHGATPYLAQNTVVARNIGDPKVQFVDQAGKAVSTAPKANLGTVLPGGVSVNDVFQTSEGQYGYYHPSTMNFTPVNPDAIYAKYGQKKLGMGGVMKVRHYATGGKVITPHDWGVANEHAKTSLYSRYFPKQKSIQMDTGGQMGGNEGMISDKTVNPNRSQVPAQANNPISKFARTGIRGAHGGNITAPISNTFAFGGRAKSLSSDNAEIKGPSHAQGGVQFPGLGAELEGGETTSGDFVFSKRLGFAQAHKPIAIAKGKIEDKPMTFERVNSLRRLNQKEGELAQLQEQLKMAANG